MACPTDNGGNMRLGNWDSVATVTAAVALLVLVALPRAQPAFELGNEAVRQAGQTALELGNSGTPVNWDDSVSGLSGSVMPLRVFRNAEGQWCRRFVITVGGRDDQTVLNRTACRRVDGEWQVLVEPGHQLADVGS